MIKESVELYFLNVGIVMILLLISYKPLFNGIYASATHKTRYNSLFVIVNIVLILLFLVYQFTETDYWSYWRNFIYKVDVVEPLQGWIRDQFDSFHLWRLVVWGGAFCIFLMGCKRLELNPRVFFPLFVLGYLSRFISREQLGIAIMFLGSTFLVKPLRLKTFSYALGISLVLASYFFHNSMIVSIAMLIPALIKVNVNRALLILVFFVPLMSLVSYLMSDALFMQMFYDSKTNTGERIDIYSEQVSNALNFYGIIRQWIYLSPIVLMLIDIIRRTSKSDSQGHIIPPRFVSFYLSYWFYMFVFSFVFFWQASSAFISVRFRDKSLFAMVVVLTYWFSIQKPTRIMKISLWLFVLYNFLNYFLTIYKAS